MAEPFWLCDPPADRKQALGDGVLRQPLLELIDELIALVQDLVLDLEDPLALATLPAFQQRVALWTLQERGDRLMKRVLLVGRREEARDRAASMLTPTGPCFSVLAASSAKAAGPAAMQRIGRVQRMAGSEGIALDRVLPRLP